MRRWTNVWSAMGLVLLAISASHLIPGLAGGSADRWTTRSLAVPLAESSDRVEILLQDRLLDELIKNRAVLLVGQEGRTEAVRAQDVRLRFNDRDAVRAAGYRLAILDGMGCTAGLLLLLFGALVVPRLTQPVPSAAGARPPSQPVPPKPSAPPAAPKPPASSRPPTGPGPRTT